MNAVKHAVKQHSDVKNVRYATINTTLLSVCREYACVSTQTHTHTHRGSLDYVSVEVVRNSHLGTCMSSSEEVLVVRGEVEGHNYITSGSFLILWCLGFDPGPCACKVGILPLNCDPSVAF